LRHQNHLEKHLKRKRLQLCKDAGIQEVCTLPETDCNLNLSVLQEVMRLAELGIIEGKKYPGLQNTVFAQILKLITEAIPRHTYYHYEAENLHRERPKEESLLREVLQTGENLSETGPHPNR